MASSLPRRIAVAVIAIPATLGLVFLGGWALVAVLAIFGVLGSTEVFRLAVARGSGRPLVLWGYTGAVLTPVLAYGALHRPDLVSPHVIGFVAVGWFIVTMATAVVRRPPGAAPLSALAVTVFAVVYTAVLPAFLLVLRHGDPVRAAGPATAVVFLPFVVTWVCDSAAMGAGAAIGGPKFAPVISPNKTWAGTIAGIIAAVIIAPIYGWLVLTPSGVVISVAGLVFLGFVLSIVGQIGDLAESLLKREAGVKDSGRAFSAHGGVLDRLDSLYWVIPTAVILLTAYRVI